MSNPVTQIVLGVDGGGTKTVAVILDGERRVRGRAQGGSTNWNIVGPEAAHANLQAVVDQALAGAGCTAEEVQAACLCAAGVDRPGDRARMESWLRALLPAAVVRVENDAVAALASGAGGATYGVVLISGTGMIVYGFDRAGRRARAGGWGALLGDEGSGYALGMEVLKAVCWAADGRGPETALTPALLTHLGLDEAERLIDWAYRDYAWARFARLAPLAITCAEAGDPVAQGILERGAESLAIAVGVVVQRLGLAEEAFPLVLAGGVLRPGPFCELVKTKLAARAPRAAFIHPPVEPAVGAAYLALGSISGK